jgi:hypothetical protein
LADWTSSDFASYELLQLWTKESLFDLLQGPDISTTTDREQ